MRRPAHLTGFFIQFAEQLDLRQNARLHALHRALRADLLPGVTDLSPSYVNLYVEYDEALIDTEAVRGWAQKHLRTCEDGAAAGSRLIEVPVRYDGPDLPDVAGRTGLSEAEVIRQHCAPDYHVYAVGFTPGFPFLGEVAEVLRLPRRSTPRANVPFNAVAIANAQTCVYPLPSPGGWNLLGTALTTIYDPNRQEPFLIAPGDRVRFTPSARRDAAAARRARNLARRPPLSRLPGRAARIAGSADGRRPPASGAGWAGPQRPAGRPLGPLRQWAGRQRAGRAALRTHPQRPGPDRPARRGGGGGGLRDAPGRAADAAEFSAAGGRDAALSPPPRLAHGLIWRWRAAWRAAPFWAAAAPT